MSRTESIDDSDIDDGPRRKPAKKPNRFGGVPYWVFGIVAAGVIAVPVVGCGCLALVSRFMAAQPGKAAKTTPDHDAFRSLVTGKTPAQVIEILGRPKNTHDNADGTVDKFVYFGVSYNAVTQTIDWSTNLRFRRGVVDEVTFF